MKAIWKFELRPNEGDSMVASIKMPAGAEILTVQMQGATPKIWALVDPTAPLEERRLQVVGTGHPFELREGAEYLGTFQMNGGSFVFHVFDMYLVLS
jgi:hypothetical protein